MPLICLFTSIILIENGFIAGKIEYLSNSSFAINKNLTDCKMQAQQI